MDSKALYTTVCNLDRGKRTNHTMQAAVASRKRLSSSMCSAEEGQENTTARVLKAGGLNLAHECEGFLQANGLHVLIGSSHAPGGALYW